MIGLVVKGSGRVFIDEIAIWSTVEAHGHTLLPSRCLFTTSNYCLLLSIGLLILKTT